MTDWAGLRDCYGSAEQIPGLLARAGTGEAVWAELWGRLCHQGSVYSASYAALPYLAVLAGREGAASYSDPLQLAAGIVASAGRLGTDAVDVERRYADELTLLRHVTERSLDLPELRDDPASFVYLLQALLAFEGDHVWGGELHGLAAGGYEVTCPECDLDLDLDLDDFVARAVRQPTPLLARAPARLDGVGARLHRVAEEHGQGRVARQLTFLFGRATCPACGEQFSIADRVSSPES